MISLCSALPKRMFSGLLAALRFQDDALWRYSSQPFKQPLLKKLVGKDFFVERSCQCFLDILWTRFSFERLFVVSSTVENRQ
jgi:hypothetical protein